MPADRRRRGRAGRGASQPAASSQRPPSGPASDDVRGQELELEVGDVAHGGFCVARHGGRVVFVRHALPGERVRARVTEGRETSKFWRADAIEVLVASPDRVVEPCPYARPGRCGGCDWQHASLPAQRRLKAAVVEEQLRRLAGLDRRVTVEAVPGDEDGLGWRTRVRFTVDGRGRAGLHKHRSHELELVERCLIAAPGVEEVGAERLAWRGAASVEVVATSRGDRAVVVDPTDDARLELPRIPPHVSVVRTDPAGGRHPVRGRGHVTEDAAGRTWRVSAGGFWQVHPGAAQALVDAVLDVLEAQPGERVLDLYAGAGLFAGALADRVGQDGGVTAVESEPRAGADARRNLHDVQTVRIVVDRVERALRDLEPDVDLVVLDPPRAGAGREVVEEIVRRNPRAVAYVACDPGALARDLATFRDRGYELESLRALDLFPMTAHVECVAGLVPAR